MAKATDYVFCKSRYPLVSSTTSDRVTGLALPADPDTYRHVPSGHYMTVPPGLGMPTSLLAGVRLSEASPFAFASGQMSSEYRRVTSA